MENLKNFKFDRPYYRQSKLLDIFSISETTLRRYIKEWIDLGKNAQDMGHLNIKGFSEICWCPVTFLHWLIANKINVAVTYDYQKVEQDKLKSNIVSIPKKKQQQLGAKQ